jgi:hypothetical protein
MTANVTSIEEPEDLPRTDPAEISALVPAALGAMLASGQAMLSGYQTMQGALLAFLQSRAKESLAVGQRLAECGSPQSALEIQLDFMREALQAYADQFAKLSELAGQAFSASIKPLQDKPAALGNRAAGLAA